MNRAEAVAALVDVLPDDLVVVAGVGATSGALWSAGPNPRHLYNMELSYPCSVALGLALARPDLRVLSMEGEGSALAGVAAYYTLARLQPANLTVLVFDNGVYGTGAGTIPSPAGDGVDVADMARAAGIPADAIHRPSGIDELRSLAATIADEPRFRFLHAPVDRSDVGSAGRPQVGLDFTEAAVLFQLELR